jgi:hypothetical protein
MLKPGKCSRNQSLGYCNQSRDFLYPCTQKSALKQCLLFIITMVIPFTNFSQQPVERVGVKGPITFNNTTFQLSWTSKPTDHYYIQEYLPGKENPDHFNQMLSIFFLAADAKLSDIVQQKTGELTARKSTDPTCNYMVSQSPDGSEYLLDFVVGESKSEKMEVEEFNVYRYKQVALPGNKKAILVYAYTKRAYGKDTTPFLANLTAERKSFLSMMVAAKMPNIVIGGNEK